MTRLVVRLLGGFRVEVDGEAVYGFETDKARALFTYLIVEADRPHRRETLASLLWPSGPTRSHERTSARRSSACGGRLETTCRRATVRRRATAPSRLPTTVGSAGPRLFSSSHLPTCSSMPPATTRLMSRSWRRSRARWPEDQGGACRFCPRRCAQTSSPALRCPTAKRSKPGCSTSRSTITGSPSTSWRTRTRPSRRRTISSTRWLLPGCNSAWNPGWRRRTGAACAASR